MKKLLIALAFMVGAISYGQVSKVKAVEHKGVTTAVRDGLNTTGVYPVIYNTTTGNFERWNGSAWETWGAGGGGSPTWGFISGTLSDQTDLQAALDLKANLAGATFTSDIIVPAEVYGVSWNGSNEAPTKDALYDKIEAVVSGGGAASLTDLSDVNTATTTNRFALIADGVDFESRAITEADISDLSHTTNTDSQDLTLTGNTLALTGDATTVSLAAYLDNTDTQDLTLATNTLSLVNGGSVDLSGYLDNTDSQTASQVAFTPDGSIAATNVQAAIVEVRDEASGGGSVQVDFNSSPLTTALTKLDFIGDGVSVTEPVADELDITINDGTADTSPISAILQWMGTKAQAYAEFGNPITGVPSNYVLYITDSIPAATTAADVVNVPSGNLIATDVQAALNELQTELDGVGGGGGDDVSAFAEKTGALVGTDRLVGLSGATDFNETISGIPLSIFNDDLTHTTDTNLTQEEVEDFAGGLVSSAGDGLVYSDAGGTLAVVDSEITITESQISDLSHTADTNTLGADGDKGDITVGGTGTTLTIDASAVQDDEIDYTAITLADFTNDANLIASVGAGRTGVIPITESYAQSQANFDLDGAPPANHHVVITDAQVTSAEIEDATIDEVDLDTSVNASLDLADSALQTDTEAIQIACSDLSTDITTGTTKAYFRMPFAMTVTDVRVSLLTAGTTTGLTVDINESGTTILSTKLTTDATEETSETAVTPSVISDSALADDAEITIDFDAVPTGGQGVIVTLIGTRT